jgi:hypothetical protein
MKFAQPIKEQVQYNLLMTVRDFDRDKAESNYLRRQNTQPNPAVVHIKSDAFRNAYNQQTDKLAAHSQFLRHRPNQPYRFQQQKALSDRRALYYQSHPSNLEVEQRAYEEHASQKEAMGGMSVHHTHFSKVETPELSLMATRKDLRSGKPYDSLAPSQRGLVSRLMQSKTAELESNKVPDPVIAEIQHAILRGEF